MFHSGPFDPDFFQNYIPLGLMGVAKINKRLPIGYKCTLVRPKVMVSVTKMDGITKQAAWKHNRLNFFSKEHWLFVILFVCENDLNQEWSSSKFLQLLTWTRSEPSLNDHLQGVPQKLLTQFPLSLFLANVLASGVFLR